MTTIRKPVEQVNFEIARMTAGGRGHTQLTHTAAGQASSYQPG